MKIFLIPFVAVATVFSVGLLSVSAQAKPNIVFIIVDELIGLRLRV